MSISPKANELSEGVHDARWIVENVQTQEAAVRGYLRNAFPGVDVDDVIQESYLKLLKARTAGSIFAMKGYFFAIARNTAITFSIAERFILTRR